MNKSRFQFAVVCAALVFGAATLHGQASRTWVSGVGDDVNPCSRTAPCKTFAGAISKTAEGGEIDALDPAGYGTVTITKAIVLDGGTGAGWASILASGVPGTTVNITTGTHINDAVVILRNITYNGISQSPSAAGTHAINYIRAAQLIVENCTTGNLRVYDCFFDNTNTGMLITTSSGAAITQVDNCRFNALSAGINTTSNAFVHARNCYFASTTSANGGVRANTSCQANVSNSMFVSNNTGVNIAGGTVRLSNNEFYNNVTAVGGGTAESANNNKFRSNTTDGNTSNVIVVK